MLARKLISALSVTALFTFICANQRVSSGSTAPITDAGFDAPTLTIATVGPSVTSLSDESYDANGVTVTFSDSVWCNDVTAQCAGSINVALKSQDGPQLRVTEDSDYWITAADLNGIAIPGTTLDEVRLNAAALGLPIDNMLSTVADYFTVLVAKDKTIKDKIACIFKALGLGGKLTLATFACSGCFATAMGAELGPPDWLAGILTCGTCAKATGNSIMGLYNLIKGCSNNPAMAAVQ